jgi:hypothetical protein
MRCSGAHLDRLIPIDELLSKKYFNCGTCRGDSINHGHSYSPLLENEWVSRWKFMPDSVCKVRREMWLATYEKSNVSRDVIDHQPTRLTPPQLLLWHLTSCFPLPKYKQNVRFRCKSGKNRTFGASQPYPHLPL